jgi:SAM-dependent methyltransferase
MNLLHHYLCRSAGWKKTLEQRVPWVLEDTDLGHDVLELGPGPGLTTDLLRSRVLRLTAVEIDAGLAEALRTRLHGTNVQVFTADATAMPFADARFSGGVSLTMLHHLPSADLQNKLLREVYRVIRPGGFFVGSDSLQSLFMRVIHIGDTLVPVDPDSFGERLHSAGFDVLEIEKASRVFRFRARRPA